MSKKSSSALREHVGQLIILGFDGSSVSAHLRSMLGTFQPGGVILFKRNIESPAQVHNLLSTSQATVANAMFRCVDLEGGTVDRLRDVVAPVPSVSDVAATGSKKLFRQHGTLIGKESRALGFNTSFAPCVDLSSPASAAVLGSRTVPGRSKQTIRYAREFLHGLHKAGVLGCGKHYPGLGEASLDSHDQLPIVQKPWRDMWRQDLLPYRKLHEELPFVMVAHAAYPDITGDHTPASLSQKWMKILRKKIGYRGLIVCDDLDMGGVLAATSIEDAAVETLRAGADMFLVCQKEESVWRALESVYKQAETDKKFAKLIAAKAQRVLALKKKSKRLKTRMKKAPTAQDVVRLRSDIAAFAEEVHARIVSEALA